MKKLILFSLLLFAVTVSYAQKYVLIDENLTTPLLYTNDVSLKNTYNHVFVVEAKYLKAFLAALDSIAGHFKYGKRNDKLNFAIGNTNITSQPITVKNEERLDVVMNTLTSETHTSMHLAGTKSTNAQNSSFINSFILYIRSYVK